MLFAGNLRRNVNLPDAQPTFTGAGRSRRTHILAPRTRPLSVTVPPFAGNTRGVTMSETT